MRTEIVVFRSNEDFLDIGILAKERIALGAERLDVGAEVNLAYVCWKGFFEQEGTDFVASHSERHGEGFFLALLHAADVEAALVVVIAEVLVFKELDFRALNHEFVLILRHVFHQKFHIVRWVAHVPVLAVVGIEPGVGTQRAERTVDAEGGDALREEHRLAEVSIALADATALGEHVVGLKAGIVVAIGQAVETPSEHIVIGGQVIAFHTQVFVDIRLDFIPLLLRDDGIVERSGVFHLEAGRFQEHVERVGTVGRNQFAATLNGEERFVGLGGR